LGLNIRRLAVDVKIAEISIARAGDLRDAAPIADKPAGFEKVKSKNAKCEMRIGIRRRAENAMRRWG
jgi:hypothetical protein